MNTLKKGLMSIAALSLAAVMGGAMLTPAFAKNGNTNTPGISIDIVKTLHKDPNVPVPQDPVVFNIQPGTQADINVSSYNGNPIYPGIANVFPSTVSIAPVANTTTIIQSGNPVVYSNHATLTPSSTATFPRAGIYRYVVTEQTPTYDGLALTPNSTASYYLDVYVTNNVTTNAKEVTDIIAWNAGQAGASTANPSTFKVDQFDFSNTYTTHDLTIQNYITGNAADTSLVFDYTLKVNTTEPNQTLYVQMPDGSYQTLQATNGVATLPNIKLGQNQTFTVYGLSANDTFTVTETNPQPDYNVSINLASGDKSDDTVDAMTETLTGKVGTSDDTWNFVNYRQGTVPTAFFTTYGPYVAGVAVLGGLGYAMFRKKKDNE